MGFLDAVKRFFAIIGLITVVFFIASFMMRVRNIDVAVSHYDPSLGGVNCSNFVNNECVSRMANGSDWRKWYELAIACPKELPFNTIVIVENRPWVCMDRGGKIIYENGVFWIDQLTKNPKYAFGSVVRAIIILPE